MFLKLEMIFILLNQKNFNNEFLSLYNNKGLTSRTDALYIYTSSSTGEKTIYDRRFKSYPIRYFLVQPNGKHIAALEINTLFNFFVDIENAIEADEIANLNKDYYESIWGDKSYLSDSLAFLQYISREPDITKDVAKEYLYLFQRGKYNSIREDEFEFHKGIKNTQEELNNLISKQDTNQIFTMLFEDEVGNYDFDSETFPIKWTHNGTQIYSDLWEVMTLDDINRDGVKLTDLRISFINTDDYTSLPLSMDKANAFVKFKKDEYGNVDRDIFMKTGFRITGLSNGHSVSKNYFSGEKYLLAEIVYIDFFALDKERYIDYYHWWLKRMVK